MPGGFKWGRDSSDAGERRPRKRAWSRIAPALNCGRVSPQISRLAARSKNPAPPLRPNVARFFEIAAARCPGFERPRADSYNQWPTRPGPAQI